MKANITPPRPHLFAVHLRHLQESLRHFFEPTLEQFINETYGSASAYLCPLCLKSLLLAANGKLYCTGQFSEDHYPPESVGGYQTVLVCKECNDKAGHDYEYVLKEELNSRSYNKGLPNAKLKVQTQIKGVDTRPLKTLFSKQNDNVIQFEFGNNIKNPLVAQWLEEIKNNSSSFEVTVTVTGNNQKLITRSLLKAAYLYCFGLFGYEFCFSETGERFRRVMAGALDYPFSHGWLFWDEDNLDKLPEGVCYLLNPTELRSYIVNIPMVLEETGYTCIFGVPIPNPSSSGWEDLKLQSEVRLSSGHTFTIAKIPHYKIDELISGYSEIWKMIEKGEQIIVPR